MVSGHLFMLICQMAALVRRALADVCTVAVLLAWYFVICLAEQIAGVNAEVTRASEDDFDTEIEPDTVRAEPSVTGTILEPLRVNKKKLSYCRVTLRCATS